MEKPRKTYAELYGPAMEINEAAEAYCYFQKLVDYVLEARPDLDLTQAENLVRSDLGYYAGYYSHETRERVERLFKCVHPVFGSAARGVPTPEQALLAGVVLATAVPR